MGINDIWLDLLYDLLNILPMEKIAQLLFIGRCGINSGRNVMDFHSINMIIDKRYHMYFVAVLYKPIAPLLRMIIIRRCNKAYFLYPVVHLFISYFLLIVRY